METLVIPAAKLGYAFVKIFAVNPPLAMTLGMIVAKDRFEEKFSA